jgi:hypothetical protein
MTFHFAPFRRHHRDADEYADALAVWAIRHGTDRHDLTPAQDARRKLVDRTVDLGIDANRVAFVGWLVETGRVSDDR